MTIRKPLQRAPRGRTASPAFVSLIGGTCAATVLVVCVGCGDGNPHRRQAVAGVVRVNGTALESGNIRFVSLNADGGGAMIVAGRYHLPAEHGLVPGRYRVQIFSAGESPVPADMASAAAFPPPSVENIPARYNVATTLEIEIVPNGNPSLDFNLET